MYHSFADMLQTETDNFSTKVLMLKKHNTNSYFSTYNLLKREGGRGCLLTHAFHAVIHLLREP